MVAVAATKGVEVGERDAKDGTAFDSGQGMMMMKREQDPDLVGKVAVADSVAAEERTSCWHYFGCCSFQPEEGERDESWDPRVVCLDSNVVVVDYDAGDFVAVVVA